MLRLNFLSVCLLVCTRACADFRVFGARPLFRLRRRRLAMQNLAVFGTCNPYVLVKMRSSVEVMTTGVRVSQACTSGCSIDMFCAVALVDRGERETWLLSCTYCARLEGVGGVRAFFSFYLSHRRLFQTGSLTTAENES